MGQLQINLKIGTERKQSEIIEIIFVTWNYTTLIHIYIYIFLKILLIINDISNLI